MILYCILMFRNDLDDKNADRSEKQWDKKSILRAFECAILETIVNHSGAFVDLSF